MPHMTWINRTVIGIVLATFLSDFSHEMCTAVLPLYLSTLGLGPAALGLIEGVADFLVSLSKLAGGVVGHLIGVGRDRVSHGDSVDAHTGTPGGRVHLLSHKRTGIDRRS